MKKQISFIFILISCSLMSQEFFQTTTNLLYSNKVIRNTGRIILGDDHSSGYQFQVYKNSATNISTAFGNSMGRLEIDIASAPEWYASGAKPGDVIFKKLGQSHNMIFVMANNNMVDPNSDTSTPTSPGVSTIRFMDVANPNSLVIFNTGKVTMGTGLYDNSDYRLFVKNGIKTEKVMVEVASTNGWADYVFKEDYNLLPLKDVKNFIDENKHLPNMPSAEKIVENGGFELKEMNVKLLEKIEELTLYIIEQDKRIEALELQSTLSK